MQLDLLGLVMRSGGCGDRGGLDLMLLNWGGLCLP